MTSGHVDDVIAPAETRPRLMRWWPIARNGVRLAFASKILRRMLYFSWAPGLWYGLVFWVFCYAMSRYSQWLERRLDTGHRS